MNLESPVTASRFHKKIFLLVKIASHMKEWARCALHHKSSVNCECSVHVYDHKCQIGQNLGSILVSRTGQVPAVLSFF